MQLSEQELVERALDVLAGNPVGTRNIVETSVRIVLEAFRAQADARPVADDARIRAIKDAVWVECEGFELMDEEARRILSALDSLTRASAATVAEPSNGEEIHVNVHGDDVYTLPLLPTGMETPRFVVHVSAAEEAPNRRADELEAFKAYNPLGYKQMDGLLVWRAACAWQRAAQQQAEHVGQACGDSAEHMGIQQPEPSDKATVPTQPTQKMIKAAADAWLGCASKLILNKAAAALKAGIAAAPKTGETK